MTDNKSLLIRCTLYLLVVVGFFIAAVVNFYNGNQEAGLLWLILCQLYDNGVKND